MTDLPKDDVDAILALHDMSMKDGHSAVCARFMKELYMPLIKIVEEEFNKDPSNCIIGLISFYSNINAQIILSTELSGDTDKACGLMKTIFCDFADQQAPLLREKAGKK